MTDNGREKSPETSGPTSPMATPPRKALLAMLVGYRRIVSPVCVWVGAWLLYATKGNKTFGRSVADLLLQLAFLLIAGTVLNWLIKRINKQRDKEQELRNKRMDFMRRMREAHVRIANAQRLIYANPSPETYNEQMRVLMLVTPELEDIERDIAATTDLFCKE